MFIRPLKIAQQFRLSSKIHSNWKSSPLYERETEEEIHISVLQNYLSTEVIGKYLVSFLEEKKVMRHMMHTLK